MSDWKVEIVAAGEILPHPNADKLEICKVYGFDVVVKKGEFLPGDLGVFIPLDALVPFTPYWTFVHEGKDDPRHRRTRARRFRGVFSWGIFLSVNSLVQEGILLPPRTVEGDDVGERLGITRYVPPEPKAYGFAHGKSVSKRNVPGFREYTDIQHLRRFPDLFSPGELVVATEKIHGANFRCGWIGGRWVVGSHHCVKRDDSRWLRFTTAVWNRLAFLRPLLSLVGIRPQNHFYGKDIWNETAERYDLKERLKDYKDYILFGEVYGPVQKLHYGSPEQPQLVFFDLYDVKENYFCDWSVFLQTALALDLPTPPVVYSGEFVPDMRLEELSESPLAKLNGVNGHLAEGVVMKTVVERASGPRAIAKLINPEYAIWNSKQNEDGK